VGTGQLGHEIEAQPAQSCVAVHGRRRRRLARRVADFHEPTGTGSGHGGAHRPTAVAEPVARQLLERQEQTVDVVIGDARRAAAIGVRLPELHPQCLELGERGGCAAPDRAYRGAEVRPRSISPQGLAHVPSSAVVPAGRRRDTQRVQ
jgi:hypothetical protein